MVNKFNLDEWVKFYGWATALEVKKLLKGCEMLVLPSRNEPFGIVILEAMASGRPVIATRSGGPEEIIIDGQNGLLVEKENAQALAMAILRLLGDKNLQGRIIEGAFTFVEKFQISNTAKEYLNTFEIT
jgi:glycosyltransferase involved in cell wall biosynthesis